MELDVLQLLFPSFNLSNSIWRFPNHLFQWDCPLWTKHFGYPNLWKPHLFKMFFFLTVQRAPRKLHRNPPVGPPGRCAAGLGAGGSHRTRSDRPLIIQVRLRQVFWAHRSRITRAYSYNGTIIHLYLQLMVYGIQFIGHISTVNGISTVIYKVVPPQWCERWWT